MRRKTLASAAAVTVLACLVSGCGSNRFERAATGGAIGTAAGAGVAAIAGAPILTGAAIGLAGGAVVGAVTSPCQIDLDPKGRNC